MQQERQEPENAGGSAEVRTLLSRHKASLARELKATNLLGVLLKRGVITELDRQALLLASSSEQTLSQQEPDTGGNTTQDPDVELFIELIQGKGFEAFREFCFALEAECPHVLTDLLVDQHAITEEQEKQQQQQQQQQLSSQDNNVNGINQESTSFKEFDDKDCGSRTSINTNTNTDTACTPTLPKDDGTLPHHQRDNSQHLQQHHQRDNSQHLQHHQRDNSQHLQQHHQRDNSQHLQQHHQRDNSQHLYGNHHHQRGNSTASNGILERKSPSPPPPPPPLHQSTSNSPSKDQLQQQLTVHPVGQVAEPPILREVLDEPVDEPIGGAGDRGWEVHHVTVTRVPGYGFGIAVSGGRDNPHFTNGDPAIAISDVLKAGPAEGKLQVNDRIISANGVSLEGADYGAAVRVLRDSGSTVLLVVKRRITGPLPNQLPPSPSAGQTVTTSTTGQHQLSPSQQQLLFQPHQQSQSHRLSLSRPTKKDDFGIVLGCRLYIREVTREGTGAKPGDVVTRIAGVQADNMSLKEARKLMDQSKERLSIVVSRPEPIDPLPTAKSLQGPTGSGGDYAQGGVATGYSSQNLYVPPPTRQPEPDKSNLAPRGRSRGPLTEVSLSQLDLPATPVQANNSLTEQPPRPPPPRPEDYYSTRRQMYEDDPLIQRTKQPMPDPRFITFQKEGSVGVRLTGGNETGVFVAAVQPGSPASLQGLQPGDKILKVNDMDMKGVTREEAVLFLLSLQEQIDLIVQHRRQEYEQIVASGKGDSFHIKTHFHYEQPEKGEMSFRSGDVFHVTDTLHNSVVGAWQVYRIGRNNQEVQKGIIPNKARAEELATAQFNATKKEMSANESRGSFFRRRRGSHRRSKSLGRDHWDDVVFSDSVSKFPAYERVVLRHPGFIRPIILFGPVADLAREKLLKDFPDKFTSPQTESQNDETGKATKSGIIRLSAIREVMDRGKHALLDITPNAVDRLNYAQFYPIVIFFKAENKQVIKEMRAGIPKSAHRSSKKLLEQCQKLDKIWGHVFGSVITLNSPESWYRKLRELIDWQQQGPLWMSQTKPEEALSDDFLFPMTSRLSYASSPESDLELSPAPSLPGTLGTPSRLKSSSDPSIATQDDAIAPPPYTTSYQVSQLVQSLNEQHFQPDNLQQQILEQHRRRTQQQQQQQQQHQLPKSPQKPSPPDLPPRLDRSSKPASSTISWRSPHSGRSAQERLINKTDSALDMGNYINATPHRANATSTLDRMQTKGSYDSMSSYDSYNTNGNMLYPGGGRLGPNVPDDLKSSTIGATSRPHDPYRFTRSTAIPVQESQTRTDYAKYSRASDYNKPTPPPQSKTGTYKPIPPPKPKNYRPPQPSIIQDENNGGPMYQHAKSYSMGNPQTQNGNENGVNMQGNNNQYYYNITPANRSLQNDYSLNSNHSMNHTSPASLGHNMSHSHPMSSPSMMSHSHSNSSGQIGLSHSHNRNNMMNGHSHSNSHSGVTLQNSTAINNAHNRESSGLDLAGSREQRGSAFELYRKPLHHHNLRSSGMARGTFGNEGGVLEGAGGVMLIVPPGALPPNSHQEIYFSVTDATGVDLYSNTRGHRSSISPPMNNGESMLSPLVECGPKGLEFLNPVELRIPHKATPAHRLALKATDTENNSSADWLNVKLPDPTSDHVIVRLDHF